MNLDRRKIVILGIGVVLSGLALACVMQAPGSGQRHRWWARLGPVLPHETFPSDCQLCHMGEKWNQLRTTFSFDHARETGFSLNGAHAQARCLRCHNDRGPVAVFQAQGCIGCHEDIHQGDLGVDCQNCHLETTWRPYGQIALHNQTRFPLTGVHVSVACFRCHEGAENGNFVPTDTECVTCHQDDLFRATNHFGLGWIDRCDRCHIPTRVAASGD